MGMFHVQESMKKYIWYFLHGNLHGNLPVGIAARLRGCAAGCVAGSVEPARQRRFCTRRSRGPIAELYGNIHGNKLHGNTELHGNDYICTAICTATYRTARQSVRQ